MITGIYPRTLGIYKEKGEGLDDRFYSMAEMFKSNGYTTIGVTANPSINSVFGFHQGFDHYVDSNRIFPHMPLKGKKQTRKGSMMSSQEVFETTIKLVKSSSRPPYYVQLNIMEMHELGAPVRKEFKRFFTGEKNRRYLQALRQVSYDISTFVKQLTALPEFGNTLFLITSDHGQGLDDHPGIEGGPSHGFLLYESQLRVPLIMYHTRNSLGKLVKKPVRNMDLFPTVADILGMEIPNQIDGISLKPLIGNQDTSVDLPDYFIAETYFGKVKKLSVYSTNWKYFENRDNWPNLNPRELQKMGVKERGKFTDQIEQKPELAKKLGAYLEDWEKKHVKVKPTVFEMSKEVIEQLRSLGYIE
jgi:arylsulfatase A-like enzyme